MGILIIGILFFIIFVILCVLLNKEIKQLNDTQRGLVISSMFLGCIVTVLAVISLGCICDAIDNKYNKKPTAIDVYRGNTTLKITYEDSIPKDTVVVFKKR